ncbi:hypothetical protein QR680_002541 [Steinernema hermaphroditum]|uniref:OCEL domain-containing protein n=1 Tax=Steinernema hermaphroditum TaxID=289476 RepID=A0AA39H343_9BILA|nr:hypothetical protein QR680_002541 [Steinernema hermaphroditum]
MNGSPPSGMSAPVQLDVNFVEDAESEQIALLFKLTDECLEAVNNAIRGDVAITFSHKSTGMFLIIGSGANARHFRVGSQPNPEGSSAVLYDEARDKYKCVAGINTKLQVQATDRSFKDTRVKAQKQLEEDKRRMTKDVQSQNRYQRPVVRQLPGSRSNAPPPSFSKSRAATETLSGPPKAPQPASNSTPPVVRPTMSAHLRQELLRKPLRMRVLHLLVTSKYPSADDIVAKIQRDGVKESSPEDAPRIRQLVEELSEKSAKGDRLTLKPNFLPEVDMRWPWFSTEEKAHIRRATAPNTASSNFAPSRRSDIGRVQAPSAVSHGTPNEKDSTSPSKTNAPTPNPPKKLIPGNVNKSEKKSPVKSTSPKVAPPKVPSPKFAVPQVPSPAPSKSPEEKNGTAPNTQPGVPKRRIANQSNHGAPTDKKPRTSPPVETETIEKPKKDREAPKKKKEAAEANGTKTEKTEPSKASNKVSSNGTNGTAAAPSSSKSSSKKRESSTKAKLLEARALFDSPQPSKDWDSVYGKIENEDECEKYYSLFNQDHSDYMQTFHKLQTVATEFEELGKSFRKNSPGTKEHNATDKQIRERFSYYVQDKDFLSNMQRHKDLKTKLGVLKERISDYHKAHGIDYPKVEMETGTGNGVKV